MAASFFIPSSRCVGRLDRAITRVMVIVHANGNKAPSYLNVAIADGQNVVVSRFEDGASVLGGAVKFMGSGCRLGVS